MSEENELPEGWVQTTLEEVTAPMRISVQPIEYPTLPYVGMEHVEAETMRLIGTVPASELKSSAVRFWPGDVLYGRLRPYLNKVLQPDFEGLCSPEFLVFRKSANLDSRYLQYFLNSWSFKEFASHLNEGDRPRVDWSQLKGFPFLLAPLSEQNRIVGVIEQQFTRLYAGVSALRKAQAKLKRYRASILKAAVEGKLTEAWRAEHPTTEPASILLENILKERRAKWEADLRAKGKDPAKVKHVEPAKPDTEGLPELPEGWCWATVEQLADVGTGATPLRSRSEDYLDGKIPWVTSGALNEEVVTFTEEFITEKALAETNVKIFPSGTLLLAMYGEGKTRGKVSELKMDAATNQACAAIVFRPQSKMCQQYVKYFLLSNYYNIRQLSVGGVQPNLNLSIVRETFVPLPPISEQGKIVDEVERHLSFISNLETIIEANLIRAERLRQSILKEAFAGRLVPQDPNEKTAIVLLEYIREERDKRKKDKQQKGKEILKSIPRDMECEKKSSGQRLSLLQVLDDVENPLTPEELFSRAGFEADDIDEFYEELRKDVVNERIEVLRPDDTQVLLKAANSKYIWKL